MDKNTIIAIVLSLTVLLGFQYIFSSKTPVDAPTQKKTAPSDAPKDAANMQPEAPIVNSASPSNEKLITVETGLYKMQISSIGAVPVSFELKKYKDKNGKGVKLLQQQGSSAPLSLMSGGQYPLSAANFYTESDNISISDAGQKATAVFEYSNGATYVKRSYTFSTDGYDFKLEDSTYGLQDYNITLGHNFGTQGLAKDDSTHTGPVLLKDSDRVEVKPAKLKETQEYSGDIKWVAVEEKYFFSAIVPHIKTTEASVIKAGDDAIVSIGSSFKDNAYTVYAGPKEHDRLKSLGLGLEHIVDFGFFSIIARPIFWLLKFFNRFVGNYGWSIIILTIVVRIPFVPIMMRGQRSMKKLQELHPKMEDIKTRHKKDPQKMQSEMMNLYKKHNVNPMSGCLPILLQIPVFFALYKVLLIAIELRGAPFMLWVTDLSQKDPVYILPIVMGITMVIQQKMTPSTGDPRQQKIMMFMPVIFTVMFLNFASGLVLYWLVNNILSIAQQMHTNRTTS